MLFPLLYILLTWTIPVSADTEVSNPGYSHLVAPISVHLTYLLPQDFLDAPCCNQTISSIFSDAENKSFISYHPDFDLIIGAQKGYNPQPYHQVNYTQDPNFTYKAGVWVYDKNEYWITASEVSNTATSTKGQILALDLATNTIRIPVLSREIVNPTGAYYFGGLVYVASLGNETDPGGIHSINPTTGEVTPILNSYFGHRFNGINSLAWVWNKDTKKRYLFFTDTSISTTNQTGRQSEVYDLPNAVWRFEPDNPQHALRAVITRSEILIPNSISVSADQTKLYITDSSGLTLGGANSTGSPVIHEYHFDPNQFPNNKFLFSLAKRAAPTCIQLDSYRNIWSAEWDSIVIRNEAGDILGEINTHAIRNNTDYYNENPIMTFGLAGNMLVIVTAKGLYTMHLGQNMNFPAAWEPDGYNDGVVIPSNGHFEDPGSENSENGTFVQDPVDQDQRDKMAFGPVSDPNMGGRPSDSEKSGQKWEHPEFQ